MIYDGSRMYEDLEKTKHTEKPDEGDEEEVSAADLLFLTGCHRQEQGVSPMWIVPA